MKHHYAVMASLNVAGCIGLVLIGGIILINMLYATSFDPRAAVAVLTCFGTAYWAYNEAERFYLKAEECDDDQPG